MVETPVSWKTVSVERRRCESKGIIFLRVLNQWKEWLGSKKTRGRSEETKTDVPHMDLNSAEVGSCTPGFLGKWPVHYSLLDSIPSQAEQLQNMCLSSTCGQPLQSKAAHTYTLLQIQKAHPRTTHSSRNRKKTNTHGTVQRWSTSQQHFKLRTLGISVGLSQYLMVKRGEGRGQEKETSTCSQQDWVLISECQS